ncbi:MAG TPA: hypothetical protein VJY62_06895 [Bacteroidia bacterium]|nr:hypothetical protein [Bacteroidia bacterium]
MADDPTPAEKSSNSEKDSLTEKDLYEQGSKSCHQYSQLTMHIRTLALTLIITFTIGLSLILSKNGDTYPFQHFDILLIAGGVILMIFACVLGILNIHYSTAFTTIRDESLVKLEDEWKKKNKPNDDKLVGPWTAHQKIRNEKERNMKRAWYGPFVALGLIGFIAFCVGLGLKLFS